MTEVWLCKCSNLIPVPPKYTDLDGIKDGTQDKDDEKEFTLEDLIAEGTGVVASPNDSQNNKQHSNDSSTVDNPFAQLAEKSVKILLDHSKFFIC